ncbi:L-type lectin-domain containing receptor kinase S.6 [Hibiscus syriacus]|uniref:L-type lectin-domain containing receptor kinase S.6 n=1 Tax=Hibiscus syriacus TaxID=106335 RepID=A0A6A2ZS65_HIBSY|nr:L-type lectin-domain containing receptor kinase S.6-like [Hibiscus syriacus]KAE8694738.1 L-type lectin-domain containing receptor kinase S.6 [Hibiscus syriacus]
MQLPRLLLFFFFTFPSISSSLLPQSNITLYGDAFFRNNGFSLTQETTCLPPSSPSDIGRALYVYPVRFLDPKSKATASFSCRFSFSIIPNPICPFGDGFVFMITSNAGSVSFSNGHMGLPQFDLGSQDSFFAVEFDTSFNPSVGDINGNHIGVDVNSIVSIISIDVTPKGVDLKSGKKITAWIEYKDSAKLILIWVSYSSIKPPKPVLVAQLDLSNQFKEYMHVGFSASNGQGSAMHIIEHWRFKTFSSYRPGVDPINGNCSTCSRNNSLENRPHKRSLQVGKKAVVLGCLVASVAFVTAVPFCFFAVRKKRGLAKGIKSAIPRVQTNNVPTRWSLAEIKSATMGFHKSRIIGKGGSAVVYKGYVPSAGTVAVKRFDQFNGKAFTRNLFNTEFAIMAGWLNHCNLVQLQGWCCEESELVLVYEYLSNGSLYQHIHKTSVSSTTTLSWSLRLKIVLGVASALSFLHEECERQIIHRDVKTCNIMLDDEFNAKLGDFGLAEVYEHCCASRDATIPAGTIGYLAPEYVYTGVPTVKTDVYSFGVVVLEVATGKRPVDENGTVLVDWIWDLWVKRKLIEGADSGMLCRYNVLEMERMLMVGLYCVHPNPENRPTVKEAARILTAEAAPPVLPSTRPTITLRSHVFADCGDTLSLGGDNNPNDDDAGWLTPCSHFSKSRV